MPLPCPCHARATGSTAGPAAGRMSVALNVTGSAALNGVAASSTRCGGGNRYDPVACCLLVEAGNPAPAVVGNALLVNDEVRSVAAGRWARGTTAAPRYRFSYTEPEAPEAQPEALMR